MTLCGLPQWCLSRHASVIQAPKAAIDQCLTDLTVLLGSLGTASEMALCISILVAAAAGS